jgi:hypothetical protein
VGYALCEAIAAYAGKDFGRAVDLLAPLGYDVAWIGGSVTQRDLFSRMLIDAAIKSERYPLARALLSEHLRWRPNNGWSRSALAGIDTAA